MSTRPFSKIQSAPPSANVMDRDFALHDSSAHMFGQPAQQLAVVPSGVFSSLPQPSSSMVISPVVSSQDIDNLGSNISKQARATTEKIISKMSTSSFDELGAILAQIQSEADKLDPASLQKTGLAGWWQRTFGNVKQQLTLRLKNADAVFAGLEQKISDHMAVHNEWIKDLETLYNENYDRYKQVMEIITEGQSWKEALENQIRNWPKISPEDPEAPMKIQAKRDAEDLLNQLKRRLDGFLRIKVVTEANAPKIRSQQSTSKVTISTLRDIVEQTIPLIKDEFALFIQSLDTQKSIQLVDSAKVLANRTLTKSADAAKQSAVEAAKAYNNPVISTDTLNNIRNKMIETVTEVNKINSDATTQRAADAKMLADTQKQYLQQLQESGAV